MLFFFFFQAEDGIRDVAVTGVQTCALPISREIRIIVRDARRLERLPQVHDEFWMIDVAQQTGRILDGPIRLRRAQRKATVWTMGRRRSELRKAQKANSRGPGR